MTKEEFRYALLDDGWTETLPDVFKYEDDIIIMTKNQTVCFGSNGKDFGIPYSKIEIRNGDFLIKR